MNDKIGINIGSNIKVRKDLIANNFYGTLRFHNGMTKYERKESIIIGRPHYNKNAYSYERNIKKFRRENNWIKLGI